MNWRQAVRSQQLRRRRRFFLELAVLYVAWFFVAALAWWSWSAVFHQPLPPGAALAGFTLIGNVLIAVSLRFGPTLPFKGKAPEEAAAEAFFAGRDVRSDDGDFEKNLKP